MRSLTVAACVLLFLSMSSWHEVYAEDSLTLENGVTRFSFDVRSGSLTEIRHTGLDHAVPLPPDVAAPVKVWLGAADQPEEAAALVSRNDQSLSSHLAFTYDGGKGLELCWNDLNDLEGKRTGVSVALTCLLDDGVPFLRMRTTVSNHGSYLITGLFLGLEGVRIKDDPALETLSVPRLLGWQEQNPRTTLLGKNLLHTIPPTVPTGMYCLWSDLSTGEAGIGTGYLNRKDMDMLGRIAFTESGGALGWQLFRLENTWEFMKPYKGPFRVYPLQRGEDFTSDEWFIGIHAGDWHETASYYRSRYERVFAGDFLPRDAQSPAVRGVDVVLNSMVAWGVKPEGSEKHDINQGILHTRFLEVPDKVRKKIADLEIEPARCLLVLIGQGTHWGIYKLPDYFPPCPEAGGLSDFKEMIRQLRDDIGISGAHFYVHGVFNHPEAEHYVKEADTGYNENLFTNFDHLGRVACLDTEPWQRLWRESILPDFVAAGASGLYFDEGFGHHLICDQPGHGHGLSAESVLTAQTRGLLRIYREFRRLVGPNGYLACESGSDSAARLVDLWEGSVAGPIEIVRFTHPDQTIVGVVGQPEDAARCFVYGMPIQFQYRDEPVLPEAVRFVRLRKALREQRAPGYPHGFQDARGVVSAPAGVIAKTYRDESGVTVCFYSVEKASGTMVIDGALLGHQGIGTRCEEISLEPMGFDYVILRAENP